MSTCAVILESLPAPTNVKLWLGDGNITDECMCFRSSPWYHCHLCNVVSAWPGLGCYTAYLLDMKEDITVGREIDTLRNLRLSTDRGLSPAPVPLSPVWALADGG
jgi:hypothetical protein